MSRVSREASEIPGWDRVAVGSVAGGACVTGVTCAQTGTWINWFVQGPAVKLSQVLELAVQMTRDWVRERPRWGRLEWSRCAVWAGRVSEATASCQGQLEQLRELLVRGQLTPEVARTVAFPLVADALATDLVVRIWLCCWARQALERVGEVHWGEPVEWARGVLPRALPQVLNRLVALRQAVLEMLWALQLTDEPTESPPDPDLEFLRREVERWTNRLTGTLAAGWGHREFCLHPVRALVWGEERLGWRGVEGPVTPWESDLLAVRALGPACQLPAGLGDELRRGVLSLLSARSAEVSEQTVLRKKPRRK